MKEKRSKRKKKMKAYVLHFKSGGCFHFYLLHYKTFIYKFYV